jgi:hypothetical protein
VTRQRAFFTVIVLLSLILAAVVSGFASSSPDGLEKVASDKGFLNTARDHDLAGSPLADYTVRGVDHARLSGGLAGAIGVGITLALGSGGFLVLRRRGTGPASGTAPTARTGPAPRAESTQAPSAGPGD